MTNAGKEPRADAAGTVALGDLRVNRLGFGAMRVCGRDIWGPPADRAAAHRVIRRAVELGVNFIDTADSYGPEVDEILIAEALHPYPPGLVIGTKGGLVRPNRHAWDSDAHPEHLRHAVNGSLQRLKLERIDLYQLHAPDPRVPFVDSVGALARMRRGGKVRHIGLSNVSVAELTAARKIAPIVSVQNEYNFDDRGSDDVRVRARIAFIPGIRSAPGAACARRKCSTAKHAAPRLRRSSRGLARSPACCRSQAALIPHLEERRRGGASRRRGSETPVSRLRRSASGATSRSIARSARASAAFLPLRHSPSA
jgi:aryl-alcohol dehydrogenase-like predicted oxidoreductase